MWTILKFFIEFVTVLFLVYVLVFWLWGIWGLSSPTRDGTHIPCFGGWSLNHWATRKVLGFLKYMSSFLPTTYPHILNSFPSVRIRASVPSKAQKAMYHLTSCSHFHLIPPISLFYSLFSTHIGSAIPQIWQMHYHLGAFVLSLPSSWEFFLQRFLCHFFYFIHVSGASPVAQQ